MDTARAGSARRARRSHPSLNGSTLKSEASNAMCRSNMPASISSCRRGSGAASILLHATAQHQQGDVDNGLIYADYYFLEALLRYRDIASGATPLTAATCALTPVLSVTPGSLSFAATQGGAAPAAQTLSVANTGGGSLPTILLPL